MELVKFFALISQLLSNLSSPSNIKKWQNRQNLKPDIFNNMLLIHFMRSDITSFPYTGILRMYELLLKILSRDIHSLYLSGYRWISLWICQETAQNLSISRFHQISISPLLTISGPAPCCTAQQHNTNICFTKLDVRFFVINTHTIRF